MRFPTRLFRMTTRIKHAIVIIIALARITTIKKNNNNRNNHANQEDNNSNDTIEHNYVVPDAVLAHQ